MDRNFRHVRGAMAFESDSGANCMQRAAALALDLPGAEIVFGTLKAADPQMIATNPKASPIPFVHAWIEWRGDVYAPTLIERMGGLRAINRESYYRENEPRDVRRLSREDFDKIAKRFALSAAFRHHKQRAGKGEYVDAMLEAAGVKWTLSPWGTILPA